MQSVKQILPRLLFAGMLFSSACGAAKAEAPSANESVQRLVSLAPSITEVVYALDAEDRLVGRSKNCDFPAAALAVESVGRIDMPNLEKIVSLNPDLVVMTSLTPVDVMRRLEDLGMRVVRLRADRLQDITEALQRVGALLDQNAEAEWMVGLFAGALADLTAKGGAHAGAAPRACILYGCDVPYFSAGKGTFPSALVERAGFSNIANTAPVAWPQLDLEWLIRQDPEVIFIAGDGEAESGELELQRLQSSALWSQVSAIRNGRVYFIGGNALSVPGFRALEALHRFSEVRAEFP